MHPGLSFWLSSCLIDRAGGHRRRVLESYERHKRHDYFLRYATEQQVAEELAKLLDHARMHVPFYRERLATIGEIGPDNAHDALAALPVVTRADIQRDAARFLADNADVLRDDATGGSTGTPMRFKVDGETQIAREASLMWANFLAGWSPNDRIAMLWGSSHDIRGARSRARLALRWRIENMRWYDAFDMGAEEMSRFHRELSRFRPHLLVAYAGSAFEFARFLRAQGWAAEYPLQAVVTSAEMLTPTMRATIEEVFHRPVFNRYGNREFGAIAAECVAHQGLHINETDCLVEIDRREPGVREGSILVTYLRNYAMPFIRYDTGDVGCIEPADACPCGRPTLRLTSVEGRQSDTIRTASGKRIHGEFFTHLLYGADGVRQFQFVQEAAEDYTLRVEGDRSRIEPWLPELEAAIRKAVGAGSRIRIEWVDSIPVGPSGKRRFTISHELR